MDSETVQVLLQEVYIFINPNRSLKVLLTFEELFQKSPIESSFEHSTNAAKNGSFLKLSLVLYFFGEM